MSKKLEPEFEREYNLKYLFGSSRTAIVVTERLKEQNKIHVVYSKEFERPNPADIADLCFDLSREYKYALFWVDGANAGFITELKAKFGEETDYVKGDIDPENMKILPVNFTTEHKQMLSTLHLYVNKEYLAIPARFDKLILSLRTAYAKEYSLHKEITSYSDSLVALRLSLKSYKTD